MFGTIGIQARRSQEVFEGWDDTGRPGRAVQIHAPLPPSVRGKKVREIAMQCPPDRMLAVKLPPGADLLQVVRSDRVALIAGSFPLDAKVTSVDIGTPSAQATRLRTVDFEPFSGFKTGDGVETERFGWRLQWFAVPMIQGQVEYRPIAADGKPIAVHGQVMRANEARAYIAVLGAEAASVSRVEVWSMEPRWLNWGNLLLDPAPPVATRADAPEIDLALEGGGRARLTEIEAVTPGIPHRVWAVDGGAPRDATKNSHSYSVPTGSNEIRGVFFRVDLPQVEGESGATTWRLDDPTAMLSSYGELSGGLAHCQFQVPPSLATIDIQMGYALGAKKLVAEEGFGGPLLNVRWETDHAGAPSERAIGFTLPASAYDCELTIEPLDAQKKLIGPSSRSGPSMRGGRVSDSKIVIRFAPKLADQVVGVRLRTRPWRWVTFPKVPMRPLAEAVGSTPPPSVP